MRISIRVNRDDRELLEKMAARLFLKPERFAAVLLHLAIPEAPEIFRRALQSALEGK